ncbi:MAG: AAA family ATPase [Planctomycetaceae bacterium]|nr:AAA family ATPase [Planctomycetaceae bacterium]
MITAIEIENFKVIRDRVSLDFRPITLLFGGNSAGKRTILLALLYVREAFERHNESRVTWRRQHSEPIRRSLPTTAMVDFDEPRWCR